MKLRLIDEEHGFDKKGRLYVLVDGKWERATSHDQDEDYEKYIKGLSEIEWE